MIFVFNCVGAKYTVSVCGAVTVPVHVDIYWKNTKSESLLFPLVCACVRSRARVCAVVNINEGTILLYHFTSFVQEKFLL